MWQRLRGTLTNMIPAAATGDLGDTMALLSNPESPINKGTFAVPFQMTDRTYWIMDGTATAIMQQIMMGTYEVSRRSFLPTWVSSVVLGCPNGRNDDYGGVCRNLGSNYNNVAYGPYQGVNLQSPISDLTDTMPFTPNITFPRAQCFAAYNPTNNNGPGSIGRGSGTSGASQRLCIILLFTRRLNAHIVRTSSHTLFSFRLAHL
jgi:hypothetical protein